MILCTGRSIHIRKIANNPISQGYMSLYMIEKSYISEFYSLSNTVGGDAVDAESHLLQLTDAGKITPYLIRYLHQRHRKLSFNAFIHNLFPTYSLIAELCQVGIEASDTCRQQFQGFPNKLNVEENAKLPYYFWSEVVNDGVATLLWMNSSPVTMMSTIHPLSGEDSLVLKMRKHPGPDNKSTNASGANFTFLPGKHQKELEIPVIVDAYN